MKLDDLLNTGAKPTTIDPVYANALLAFGFVTATYTLYRQTQFQGKPPFVGTITALRRDGSFQTWIGVGNTEQDAEMDAFDALARWILNQSIPSILTP